MFSSVGLFKNVPCPNQECFLNKCIFDHSGQQVQQGVSNVTLIDTIRKTPSTSEDGPPPTKKRRLEIPDVSNTDGSIAHGSISLPQPIHKKPDVERVVPTARPTYPMKTGTTTLSTAPKVAVHSTQVIKPASATRPVSPPPKNPAPAIATPAEKLIPRQVASSPIAFKSRMSYVELLFKLAKGHNDKVVSGSSAQQHMALREQELIRLVLDSEQEVASSSNAEMYKNAMSQRYLKFKNMSSDEWEKIVSTTFRAQAQQPGRPQETVISTGLTAPQEIDLLRGLKTAVAGLESFGYVTNPPTAKDIEKAEAGVKAAHFFEGCDRCGSRFQVFPGRDEQGRLTTQGACFYHWARSTKLQTMKNARMVGHADSVHSCCNQSIGSEGCTKAETHVFKVSDPKRLATLLQFEKTPESKDPRHRPPVAFDCEMAYTTYGMEMVRVTAISWPDHKELLDVLVRPYGEILDLNTRFSGVSADQFTNALPYEVTPPSSANVLQGAAASSKSLRKVDSPAAARALLFDLLTPSTPLIGHAIENDLTVCRIIHPFIIDTVLLYPHPTGLPLRYGLKFLASKYLHRAIQTGGEQGHDSKEDSIATGDLVRLKVAEKWKNMRLQGWTFENGRLLLPKK